MERLLPPTFPNQRHLFRVPGAATENLKDDKEEDGLQIEGGVPDYAKAREKRLIKATLNTRGLNGPCNVLGLARSVPRRKSRRELRL